MLLTFSEKNQIEKLNMYPFGYGKTEDVAYAAIYLLLMLPDGLRVPI